MNLSQAKNILYENNYRIYALGHGQGYVVNGPNGTQVSFANGYKVIDFVKSQLSSLSSQTLTDTFTNRTFGVELECYHPTDAYIREHIASALARIGINANSESYNHSVRRYWKVVTDASIHGGYGAEVVSPVLSGSEGLEELRKVLNVLDSLGCRVNKSTGTHVHQGADGFTNERIRKTFEFYAMNERHLDNLFSYSRRGSNNNYSKSLRGYSFSSSLPYAISHDRYHKLNYCSYVKYGTLEFRQHQGTLNFDKLSHWIILTNRIMENGHLLSTRSFNNLEEMLVALKFSSNEIGWYLERVEELAS